MPHEPIPALIRWRPPEQGGRRQPFTGDGYSTAAEIDGLDGQLWSVTVTFDDGKRTSGAVAFLVESAPHERLTPGTRFRLLEGPRVTADGEIVVTSSPTVRAVAASPGRPALT